jgi:hypothetical protein
MHAWSAREPLVFHGLVERMALLVYYGRAVAKVPPA